MDSGMIGKIQKAKRYAQERERFTIETLLISVDGTNNGHHVELKDGKLSCTCDFINHANIAATQWRLKRL